MSGGNGTVTRGWTYDANGNRLSETGSAPSTYTIAPGSNRITGITGALARTYGYDAAGNALSYATVTATYNNRGRLKTLSYGSNTASFAYNALGQMVQTTEAPEPSYTVTTKAATLRASTTAPELSSKRPCGSGTSR
jgi:uncharacterized protein RhaS with RHS repeats